MKNIEETSTAETVFLLCFFCFLDEKGAYEGRSLVNLQMGNTFGAFLDVNNAIRVILSFFKNNYAHAFYRK